MLPLNPKLILPLYVVIKIDLFALSNLLYAPSHCPIEILFVPSVIVVLANDTELFVFKF